MKSTSRARKARARYPLSANPLLKATVVVEDNRIKIESSGPLAYLPSIRATAGMMNGQVPALAGDTLHLSTWIPPVPGRAFDRLVRSYLKSSLGIRTPDQVTISITEECPNRCVHCALPDTGHHLRLEPELVRDLIDQVLNLGTTLVIFDGGEPTTYEELPELVGAVDDRAISSIFTSGAGFTAELARRLKASGLYAVNVSLDSPVAEEHDSMRGRNGAFHDAVEAAKNALDAGLLVDFYVVIRRDNVSQMEDFHRLARTLGVHELTFFEVVPVGRWEGKAGIILSEEDKRSLDRFQKSAPAPRVFSVPSALDTFGCFAGRNWMHITPSGEVYPCACLPRGGGNVMEEPIKNIWSRMAKLPYKGRKKCPLRRK